MIQFNLLPDVKLQYIKATRQKRLVMVSATAVIAPMMSYFGLILAWATRYDKNFGIGTMIAMMLPYSIFFTIFWMILFFLWVFGFGLPVGPGSPTYYPAG